VRFLWIQLVVLLSAPVSGQEAWQLVKSESSVSVYTRQESGSEYKSIKAVGLVRATPEEILMVLDDVDQYEHWFAFSKSIRLLKRKPNQKYVYIETSFPWPFRNEDMIYKISTTKNSNDEIKLVLNGRSDFIPPIDGIQRMRDAKGYILLQKDKEHTLITYVLHAEPGGGISPWLANTYIHLLPFQTLRNLIKLVKT